MIYNNISIQDSQVEDYNDVYTSEALSALSSLSNFNTSVYQIINQED